MVRVDGDHILSGLDSRGYIACLPFTVSNLIRKTIFFHFAFCCFSEVILEVIVEGRENPKPVNSAPSSATPTSLANLSSTTQR
uniref:Uncharacterized protein n=1 Tax=Steinernema glaseri TaxID=37863 RepID=A0A1I8AQR2_9BILA